MATNRIMPGVGKISQLRLAGEHLGIEAADPRSGDVVRACEVCGTERASSDMIAFHMVISSPGHYSLPPFQHPEIEHWACSVDHWDALASRVQGEMKDILVALHTAKKESVHYVESPKVPD